jgi:hypothetical protein
MRDKLAYPIIEFLIRGSGGQPLRSLRSGKPASWHHCNGSTTARAGSRIHSLMIPQRQTLASAAMRRCPRGFYARLVTSMSIATV